MFSFCPLRSTSAGAILAGLLLLCSCSSSNGVAELAADEIFDRMQSAVAQSTSVRVVGTGVQGETSVSVDLQLDSAGNATGYLDNEGERVDVVAVEGEVYISADEGFWVDQVGAGVASQLAGKFVAVPDGDASFAALIDYEAFLESLLAAEGSVDKGGETTVAGVDVVELIDSADDGSLFVALEGQPLPQKVIPTEGGQLMFSDWNSDVSVEQPPNDEIVDPSTLLPSP